MHIYDLLKQFKFLVLEVFELSLSSVYHSFFDHSTFCLLGVAFADMAL